MNVTLLRQSLCRLLPGMPGGCTSLHRMISQAILLALLAMVPPALAVDGDFYAARVPVADRQPDNFKKALREALVQVLSKVSGASREVVVSRPALVQALAQGDDLASQFVYLTEKQHDGNGDSANQLYLKASFPEQTIIDLLQKGGLTFWSADRPSVLLLPMLSAAGSARWLYGDHWYEQQLQQWQQGSMLNWGLSVTFRAPDGLLPQQLWQLEPAALDRLQQQLQRPLAIARLDAVNQQAVSGNLVLVDGGQQWLYPIETATLDAWLASAMDQVVQQLAGRYAVQLLSTDSEIMLVVDEVADYAAYQQLLAYLQALDIVKTVYVLGVDQQTLRLAVSLQADVAQLRKQLADDGRLQPAVSAFDNLYQLNLRWQPAPVAAP